MSETVDVLYFAALAEQLCCASEQIALPSTVGTVGDLQQWLVGRGSQWEVLASPWVSCAVNQAVAKLEHPIQAGDQVAFFPPVTGG